MIYFHGSNKATCGCRDILQPGWKHTVKPNSHLIFLFTNSLPNIETNRDNLVKNMLQYFEVFICLFCWSSFVVFKDRSNMCDFTHGINN